jgi:flagellar protein FlbT
MPLKISLKPNEKIIVNGAVLQNGDSSGHLIVHNEASLLREKEILADDEHLTPAQRVYYALQCAYLFPSKIDTFLPSFYAFLKEFVEAAPSVADMASEVGAEVEAGRLYQALRKARRLIEREQEILNAYGNRV